MAQKTVCDRCLRNPNGLEPVKATFGIEIADKDVATWKVKFMCPKCRATVELRIAAAMAPPVKRGAKETKVDAETPA